MFNIYLTIPSRNFITNKIRSLKWIGTSCFRTYLSKTVNSAFIGTNLETYLRKNQICHLVVVGLTLPHCVSTTTRMAANLGFEVTLLADATASFTLSNKNDQAISPETIHEINLLSLQDEFAQILTTEEFLASISIKRIRQLLLS